MRTYRLRSLAFGCLLCLVWACFAAERAAYFSAKWPAIHDLIAHNGVRGYYIAVAPQPPVEWGALRGGR